MRLSGPANGLRRSEALPPHGGVISRPASRGCAPFELLDRGRGRWRGRSVDALAEATHDDRLEVRRHVVPWPLRRRLGRRLQMQGEHFRDAGGFEHRPASEQVVADGAHRVEVAAHVAGCGRRERFRRHVERRSRQHDRGRHRDLGAVGGDRLDQPEIEHLDDVGLAAALGQEDVRRLDVAVEQAALVRFGQGAAHLPRM